MKNVTSIFGVRRFTSRELAIGVGVAAISLGPTVVSADLPPYEGSADEVSYGDMPHATLGSELPTPDGTLSLGSSHDEVSYSEAPVATERRAADVREGAEIRAAFERAADEPKASAVPTSGAQEK
jgi:hypothetical protein